MGEYVGIAICVVEACLEAAGAIQRLMVDFRQAREFVSEFEDSCKLTRSGLGELTRSRSGHLGGEQQKAFSKFDKKIDLYLTELRKLAAKKSSMIARFVPWGRFQILWNRDFLNRMREDFLRQRDDIQFHLVCLQLDGQPLGGTTRLRRPSQVTVDRLRQDLMEAVAKGDVSEVRACLRQTPDLGFLYDFHGFELTALHLAAEWGWDDLVQPLLDGGADINALDSNRSTPLMSALRMKRLPFAKLLIENDAAVDLTNHEGKTALHIAASVNLPAAVRLLLGRGVDPNSEDYVGETPLHGALASYMSSNQEKIRVVEELLGAPQGGADPCGGRTIGLHTPLHVAASKNLVAELNLLAAAARENGTLDSPVPSGAVNGSLDSFGETALWLAAHNGHMAAVEILLLYGARASTRCHHPEYPTPLWAALAHGRLDIAEQLFKTGDAAPDVPDAGGQCILHKGWGKKQRLVVGLLLEKGADPRVQDSNQTEAIHYAIEAHDLETAGLLLKPAPDAVNAVDGSGGTPLTLAASERGSIDLVLWLLSRGASVNPPSGAVSHALYCACLAGDEVRVAALLGAAGCGAGNLLRLKTSGGNQPLHAAARAGAVKVVKMLTALGADTQAVSGGGETPLAIARAAGHEEVVRLFEG